MNIWLEGALWAALAAGVMLGGRWLIRRWAARVVARGIRRIQLGAVRKFDDDSEEQNDGGGDE